MFGPVFKVAVEVEVDVGEGSHSPEGGHGDCRQVVVIGAQFP